tara:strand:+ start:16384 stop:17301 length:918 start_codon:yes stop_codon:yes gene_type:complete
VIIASLIVSNSAIIVASQDGVTGWSATIADEDGEIQKIVLSNGGGAIVPILIQNDGLTSIEVSLECTGPFESQVACPADVTVGPGQNVTVDGVISGVDVMDHPAGTTEDFQVTATVTARQGIPVALPGDTNSDDVAIEIPAIHMLSIEIDDPLGPINAGADTILRMTLSNNGNIADRASEVEVSVDCTLITVGNQISELTNREVAVGGSISANVVFEAALSHPSKYCDVEVQAVSQGSGGSQSSSDDTRIEVQAATNDRDNDDGEKGDDGGGTVEVVTTGLPALGAISSIIVMISAAIITARMRR